MSPKECSLAYVEEKEADEYQEPQLKVLDGKLLRNLKPSMVQLGGQITVSF